MLCVGSFCWRGRLHPGEALSGSSTPISFLSSDCLRLVKKWVCEEIIGGGVGVGVASSISHGVFLGQCH